PIAWPCSSVTVTHQVLLGLAAAAVARSRASQGSMGPSPASSPGRSARPVMVASGTVRVTRPANAAGVAGGDGASESPGPGPPEPALPASVCVAVAGARILAQEQVQVGASTQLVHATLQACLSQFGRPGRDALVRGQHLVRRELTAHQGGVARVLGPPL